MLAIDKMNLTSKHRFTASCAAVAAVVLYCAVIPPAAAKNADSAQATPLDSTQARPTDPAEAKAKLAAVRARIAALTGRLSGELKERDALSARLREAELVITAKRRRLDTLHAAELAAEPPAVHSKLAGVILDQPLQDATAAIFSDSRSRLVPAHWLVQDRYDLTEAASKLPAPSLWLFAEPQHNQPDPGKQAYQGAYASSANRKSSSWLKPPIAADPHFAETLRRWLDDLP